MSLRITRRQFGGVAVLIGAGGAAGVLAKLRSGPAPTAESSDGEITGGPAPAVAFRVRPTPVEIEPYPDLAELVPVKRAVALLSRLAPCWYPLKTGKVMHAFRLWGPDAVFPPHLYTHP